MLVHLQKVAEIDFRMRLKVGYETLKAIPNYRYEVGHYSRIDAPPFSVARIAQVFRTPYKK
jgi:hypothetical protein